MLEDIAPVIAGQPAVPYDIEQLLEKRFTLLGVPGHGSVQPLCAQPRQISRRSLGAGQDDPIVWRQTRSQAHKVVGHTSAV